MRTLAKRWAQKSTTGAEFPPVRRAISMLHRVVPRRISKARDALGFRGLAGALAVTRETVRHRTF
jgi:hypothetical protein